MSNGLSLIYPVRLTGSNKTQLVQITDPEKIHLELMKQIATQASEIVRLRSENLELKDKLKGAMPNFRRFMQN